MPEPFEQVLTYHQQTKHHFNAYARSLGYLDWATQPDPFRRYRGAPVIELARIPPGEAPLYEPTFVEGNISPTTLDAHSVSQLFFDSLAISAWKQAGGTAWALRVNPSSGNLHPTEGYLICGPVKGLCESPMVCHYAPKEHLLEKRVNFPFETWRALTDGLPHEAVLVGLTSIHWREAWKYGERAFRYCQHDVGHAIAAISIAAAGLGWRTTVLDDVGTRDLAGLLGIVEDPPDGTEAEYPDCLLLVYRQDQMCTTRTLPANALHAFPFLEWQGKPNQLSPSRVEWPIIDDVTLATVKPPTSGLFPAPAPQNEPIHIKHTPVSLRPIIHQRRSAVAMDGRTEMPRDVFYKILRKTLANPGRVPFNTLPWRPQVHLALFVHRIRDVAPGLYILVRDAGQKEMLQASMRDDFVWKQPDGCPDGLALYELIAGDVRIPSRQLSCNQAIASDGCFSLGMLADFEQPLQRFGPWFYPRLFWECGMIGQVLYLEAESAGMRGTGIGCFFDDPVHRLLGLEGLRYQSLYHFTIGGPVEDPRLATLPAYPTS